MPNRDVHAPWGARAGALSALGLALGQHPVHVGLETLGGAVGGRLGSRLPDVIDPPTHPNHRSIGHGLVPVAGGTALYYGQAVTPMQDRLRAQADRHAFARSYVSNPFAWLLHLVCEGACRFFAGFVAGVPAGYVSHVALDAFTPKSIPVFS